MLSQWLGKWPISCSLRVTLVTVSSLVKIPLNLNRHLGYILQGRISYHSLQDSYFYFPVCFQPKGMVIMLHHLSLAEFTFSLRDPSWRLPCVSTTVRFKVCPGKPILSSGYHISLSCLRLRKNFKKIIWNILKNTYNRSHFMWLIENKFISASCICTLKRCEEMQ